MKSSARESLVLLRRAWSPVLAATLAMGCSSAQTVTKSEATLQGQVDNMMGNAEDLDGTTAQVRLLLANPRSEPVRILGVEYTMESNDIPGAVKGATESGVMLEAQQTAELNFEQPLKFSDEEEPYLELMKRGSFNVHLKGKVNFGDGSSVPFERHGEIATPILPSFIVHDAQAARYGKDGLDVTFFLRLVNENMFAVMIESVSYTVSVNDVELKKEQGAIGVRLIQGAQEFEVSTQMGPNSKLLNPKEILAAGRLTYKITGEINLPSLDLPFEHTGEIVLGGGAGEE